MIIENKPQDPKIEFRPIGYVRNGIAESHKFDEWRDLESEIVVNPEYAEGLDGIDGYSHLVVLFYFHLERPQDPASMKLHPRGRSDLPLVGVFATRTQFRPNRIGLTTPRLLRREGNVLVVKGLDTLDGTPILDIKGISPRRDCPADASLPGWVDRL